MVTVAGQIKKPEIDPTKLKSLIELVSYVQGKSSEMQLQTLMTLLKAAEMNLTATKEMSDTKGKKLPTVKNLAVKLDSQMNLSAASTGRNVTFFTKDGKVKGSALLETSERADRRIEKIVHVTTEGENFINEMLTFLK